MAVRAVGGTGGTGRARAKPPGPVLKAARKSLKELGARHPLAELLGATVERLARDVDESTEVRDRVAAAKALMDVAGRLEVVPASLPSTVVDDEHEDVGGGRGDPFDIGDMPPGVGDAEAS